MAAASAVDEAPSYNEALAMACAATRKTKVLVSSAVHPEYRQVLQTYADGIGLQVESVPYREGGTDLAKLEKLITADVAAVIVQQPTFFGTVEDLTAAAELIHQAKGLLIAVVDPVAMGLLASPSTCGADIVVGEGQGLGIPMNFGGPHLGFMACTEKLLRRMPGRIVGETKDSRGNRGFVLTLQAREQHIRREKATSNICSNQALCALAATVHLSLLGKQGFRQVAEQSFQKAHYAQQQIVSLKDYQRAWSTPFFKEFVVKLPKPAAEVNYTLLQNGIIGGLDLGIFYPELADHMLFCVTETRTRGDIDRLVAVLGGDV
jgi:glycine dehydrogenase subunit 1